MKYFIYCRKSQEAEDRQILSLESQKHEVEQLVAADPSAEIVDTYVEAYSAKAPGRKLFDEMLDRIEKGEAEGIISWHPDRLARNSMDGGRIIYLLDQGKLMDMKFCSYSFENSSQGKFMLNIIFGYSKYYVDSLSENVKRGQRAKLKNGWQPNRAPLGYRNCRDTGHILPDKKHFKAVRGMFDLLLSGNYSVAAIHRIVCHEWAYKTPIHKTIGGKAPCTSNIHRILSNPFYAGYILWNGKLYDGAHKPVVTKAEFQKAQEHLGIVPTTRPQKREFTYAGLFTCGACGKAVTAEYKRQKSGHEYIYYHCTRVHTSPKCTQPSIEETALTQQIETFLDQIHLPKEIAEWLIRQIETDPDGDEQREAQNTKRHLAAIRNLERQISNLTDLRVRELLDDDEFEQKRTTLRLELGIATENHAKMQNEKTTFEPAKFLILLCSRARYWFSVADTKTRQKLLRIVCSNLQLIDKKTILEAAKPFMELREMYETAVLRGEVYTNESSVLRRELDVVRTIAPDNNMAFKENLRKAIKNIPQTLT